MAELLNMNDFLDKKIEFLSTGMKQKSPSCPFHNPRSPVMIFDEPTAGLDILTARNIVPSFVSANSGQMCAFFHAHHARSRAPGR
jgi:sodium transport system ATP-binding protein